MRPHIAIPERPRPRQFRVRSLMVAVAACALAAWIVRDPFFRSLGLLALAAVGLPVLILGLLMGLGWLGFALAAVLSRVAGWVRRSGSFPDDPPGA